MALSALERRPPTKAGEVSLHIVDGYALLFVAATQKTYELNKTAGYIACCRAEQMSLAETLEAYARTFERSTADARWDIERTLEHLAALDAECFPGDPPTARPPCDAPPAQCERRYRIFGRVVALRFATCWDGSLRREWRHLEDSSEPELTLTIAELDDEFAIIIEARIYARCRALEELAPKIVDIVIQRLATLANPWLGLHGAAIGGPRGAVLLTGPSGGGKSTLTASLSYEDPALQSLADDAVLVDQQGHVLDCALPLTIRRGSWASLEALVPSLRELPPYRRGAEALRYLPPPEGQTASGARRPVRALVFTRFDAAHRGASLNALSPIDSLRSLNDTSFVTAEPLDGRGFEGLIAWLARTPCYQLNFGDTTLAMQAIRGMID